MNDLSPMIRKNQFFEEKSAPRSPGKKPLEIPRNLEKFNKTRKAGRDNVIDEIRFPGLYEVLDETDELEIFYRHLQNMTTPMKAVRRAWLHFNAIANSPDMDPDNIIPSLKNLGDYWGTLGLGYIDDKLGGGILERINIASAVPDNRYRKQGSTVETAFSMPEIYLAFQTKHYEPGNRIDQIVKYFIPQFEMPRTWRKEEKSNILRKANLTFNGSSSEVYALKEKRIKKFPFTPPVGYPISEDGSTDLDLGPVFRGVIDVDSLIERSAKESNAPKSVVDRIKKEKDKIVIKSWEDVVFVRFDIEEALVVNGVKGIEKGLLGTELSDVLYNDRGEISSVSWVVIKIVPTFFFRWPADYVAWVLMQKDPKNIIPKQFVDLINLRRAYFSNVGNYTPPRRVGDLTKIRDLIEEREKRGIKNTARVNEDSFCVMNSNIIFIPKSDHLKLYYNLIRKAYDPEKGTVPIEQKEMPEGMANLMLFTDWSLGIFVYTDSFGELKTIKLNGNMETSNDTDATAFAIDDADIGYYMTIYKYGDPETVINDDKPFGATNPLTRFFNKISKAQIYAREDIVEKYKLTDGNVFYLIQLIFEGKNPLEDEQDLNPITLDYIDFFCGYKDDDDSISTYTRDLLEEVKYIATTSWEKLKKERKLSVEDIVYYNIYYFMYQFYGAKFKVNDETNPRTLAQKRYVNNNSVINSSLDKLSIPHMAGLPKFYRHQADVVAKLDQSGSFNRMIDVEMGGGKTITIIADILGLLSKQKIKRPLVVCPTGLIREFVKSINWVTAGKIKKDNKGKILEAPSTSVNPVVLTTKEITRLRSKPFYMTDSEILDNYKSYPPNTIFITSYEFVRQKGNAIPYGPTEITVMQNLDMLREFNFDYVVIDESHKAKANQSTTTKAVRLLMANAKYRTLSSGTIINNNTSDIVGQMSQLNSLALGSRDDFIKRFVGENQDKVIKLSNRDIAQMQNAVKYFAQRIVKKHHDWAHMLPKMEENYHIVEFTPIQQVFYDFLVEVATIEAEIKLDGIITDDGKIKPSVLKDMENRRKNNEEKRKQKENENDEQGDKVEGAMRTSLQRVEKFICAPGADKPDDNSEIDRIINAIKDRPENVNIKNSGKYSILQTSFKDWKGDPELNIPAPTEKDLISPKVAKINELVAGHFGELSKNLIEVGFKPDPKFKLIIFSYHKDVSVHVFENLEPKFKSRAVHYSADKKQSLDLFLNPDSGVDIIVADETSLMTGFNLQIASRIIRVQTIWNPGDLEQSMARVHRPVNPFDMYDENGNPLPMRELVYQEWILVQKNFGGATIDSAKAGRLMSKVIDKARVDNYNNTSEGWIRIRDMFEKVELIRLNPTLIQEMSFKYIKEEYLSAYKKYRDWQEEQDNIVVDKLKEEVTTKLGREPNSLQEFIIETMVDLEGSGFLPGAKKVYTPWVLGGEIKNELGLTSWEPLAVFDDQEDVDKEKEISDNNLRDNDKLIIEPNMGVMTEFGPGVVVNPKPGKKTIQIDVKGIGKVNLSKGLVYAPTDEIEIKKLKTIIIKGGQPRIPGKYSSPVGANQVIEPLKDVKKVPVKKPVLKEPPKPLPKNPQKPDELKPLPNKNPEKSNKIIGTVLSGTLNNAACVFFIPDDEDKASEFVRKYPKFNFTLPAYSGIVVKYLNQLQEIMNYLSKNFIMDKQRLSYIMGMAQDYADMQRKNPPFVPVAPNSELRLKQFYLTNRRPLQQGEVRPYLTFWDGEMCVIFDENQHQKAGTLVKLRQMLNKIGPRGKNGRALWNSNTVLLEMKKMLLAPVKTKKSAEAIFNEMSQDSSLSLGRTLHEAREELNNLKVTAPIAWEGEDKKTDNKKPAEKPLPTKKPIKPAGKPAGKPAVKPLPTKKPTKPAAKPAGKPLPGKKRTK